jgi:hypothetical protein
MQADNNFLAILQLFNGLKHKEILRVARRMLVVRQRKVLRLSVSGWISADGAVGRKVLLGYTATVTHLCEKGKYMST